MARHHIVYNNKGEAKQTSTESAQGSHEVDAVMIDLEATWTTATAAPGS